MAYVANIGRSQRDPRILRSGPSSVAASDGLARALGWFSIALGLTEILAPRALAGALGMRGSERLIRGYGAREIASGVLSLSVNKQAGLWSRLAGDGLDVATLMTRLGADNPKRNNVALALTMVVGVSLLDLMGTQALAGKHSRSRGQIRDYSDRSGFPNGVLPARGLARRGSYSSADLRAVPRGAQALAGKAEIGTAEPTAH